MTQDEELDISWTEIKDSLNSQGGSNINVDHAQCQIPGLSKIDPKRIDNVRKLFSIAHWIVDIAAILPTANRNKLNKASVDARQTLMKKRHERG